LFAHYEVSMNIPQKAILVMTMSLLAGCGTQQTPPDPMALVVSERAFAASAAENGMRDAFLSYSSDDAVMFVPEVVRVKEHYQGASKRPGILSWHSVYAEIASGGDMGWTTGPWEFRPERPSDTPVAFGQYNTIWKRQADSTWRFVVDMGVAHGPHRTAAPQPVLKALPFPAENSRVAPDAARDELMKVEREFSAASASEGVTAAYLPRMAEDIRMYRMGRPAMQGVPDATAILSSVDGSLTWEARFADVARNGDMGYTYGVATLASPQTPIQFSYLHIWRRTPDGVWKLALEVQIPIPPAQETAP
jgi:ketosteroid isomerase-like protein